MALISVIVPVYNAEKYLQRCVKSLTDQTFKDLEIILVDDGSKDSSGSLCDKLALEDKRIKVIHSKNGGVSNARNLGLSQAQGKYVSFVDSDDWLEIRTYELLTDTATKENSDVILCDYFEVYTQGIYPHKSFLLGKDRDETILNMINHGPRGGNIFNFILIKKDILEQNDLKFPSRFKRGEDFWFTLHTYVHSHKISKVEIPLYYYDLSNTESATHNEILDKTSDYLSFMDECIVFLKKHNCWSFFEEAIYHRILLEKTIWAIHPDCFQAYRTIHHEVNSHIKSCPFLGKGMKVLMLLLNRKLDNTARILLYINNLRNH